MDVKKIAWTATLAGAISAATLGPGAGAAQADPKHKDPGTVPSATDFGQPPGHVGNDLGVAPGQFKKLPEITIGLPDGTTSTIDNPFFEVPPGHWNQDEFQAAVDAATQ